MERAWHAEYPAGIPTEIDPESYPSVVALLEEAFQAYRERVAYVGLGHPLSFGELDAHSAALAAWLQQQGVKPGDRVAIMMPNILPFPVALAAVLRSGAIAVPVNPLYTARELEHQLKDSGASTILLLESFAATLEQVIARTDVKNVVVASMGDLLGVEYGNMVNHVTRKVKKLVPPYELTHTEFAVALRNGQESEFQPLQIGPDDIALLQYTGGTTGVSKGAVLRQRTLVASMLASEAWMQPGLRRKGAQGQATIVCALPLYHIFSLVVCAFLGMRIGARNILIPNPRDLDAMIDTLVACPPTIFPAVNTMYQALLAHPRFAEIDWSKLAIANSGGTAVQSRVAQDWFAAVGVPIIEGYGMSETTAGVTCNRTDNDLFTGTIGLPLPGVDIRILDDGGEHVPYGTAGEIAIKGAQVMTGYWQRDDDNAQAFTADGYFKSGDVGIMDARGYVKIVDRKKDMILVSGFNVYPNEIEDVMTAHPGVLECAAVGVRDDKTGEAVKIFVVKRDAGLTEGDLVDHAGEQLTAYKRPRHIEFRDSLPKSNVGKILRRELRETITSSPT